MRRIAALWAVTVVPPEASSTAYTSKPAFIACNAGNVRHTSVQRAAMTSFFLPVAFTAVTNFSSSQEFMELRSTGSWSGKISSSWGHMLPEKPLDSTVVRMVGTLNILAALARSRTLLKRVCRSMLATPKTICGWKSMKMTAEFRGSSSSVWFMAGLLCRGIFGCQLSQEIDDHWNHRLWCFFHQPAIGG